MCNLPQITHSAQTAAEYFALHRDRQKGYPGHGDPEFWGSRVGSFGDTNAKMQVTGTPVQDLL